MSPDLVPLTAAILIATSVSAAHAETVFKFPYKGAPYAVHVPDKPSTARLWASSKYARSTEKRRSGRWGLKRGG
jgi:hypothetical protein